MGSQCARLCPISLQRTPAWCAHVVRGTSAPMQPLRRARRTLLQSRSCETDSASSLAADWPLQDGLAQAQLCHTQKPRMRKRAEECSADPQKCVTEHPRSPHCAVQDAGRYHTSMASERYETTSSPVGPCRSINEPIADTLQQDGGPGPVTHNVNCQKPCPNVSACCAELHSRPQHASGPCDHLLSIWCRVACRIHDTT